MCPEIREKKKALNSLLIFLWGPGIRQEGIQSKTDLNRECF